MNYISQAADSLLSNAICDSIVTPDLYTLLADWQKREVPLAVLIKSIEQTATGQRGDGLIPELRARVNKNFASWAVQNSNLSSLATTP